MRAAHLASRWRFRQAIEATAAIEFALIFPVLVILMLSGLQVVTYIDATRKVERVAASVAQMLSQATPPTGSTTATATPLDIHFGYDSALVLFPYVMKDASRQNIGWWQDIEIDFASIQFSSIVGTTCNNPTNLSACYIAQVAWTASLGTHGRPCLPLQLASSNSATTNSTTLPSSIFGPGSVIAIDVYFTFRPTFASSLLPAISIARSVYLKPRYANFIAMDFSTPDSMVTRCPGF